MISYDACSAEDEEPGTANLCVENRDHVDNLRAFQYSSNQISSNNSFSAQCCCWSLNMETLKVISSFDSSVRSAQESANGCSTPLMVSLWVSNATKGEVKCR